MTFSRMTLAALLSVSAWAAFAQNPERTMTAVRISTDVTIDGRMDEVAWQTAQPATDFIQNSPKPGATASHATEVSIVYDNSAVYVGAVMYDSARDSIATALAPRDWETPRTDFIGFFFDTYNDDINAFAFFVTAGGVQMDGKFSAFGLDKTWDAVWQSAVSVEDNRWTVEARIPYSALRFPADSVQDWGVNFMRDIKHLRETDYWNEVKPDINNWIIQSGRLQGIEGIEPPVRLALIPYLSAYAEHYPFDVAGRSNFGTAFRGGMDVQYGLSESFTLSSTLIPDFGQVVSDNQVLNLGPFEVQFAENRPFFMEGTELFSKGNLFYSRRVGGRPMRYYDAESQAREGEILLNNPADAQLYNATKVSGRTGKGLGVGLFNAISAAQFATFRDTVSGETRDWLTQPLTNYSIAALDQNLPNNSSISLVNTNVTRNGHFADANVTAGLFQLADKESRWLVTGEAKLSQRNIQTADDSYAAELGYSTSVGLRKTSGNFQFGTWYLDDSPTFNPNDLGFQQRNNLKQASAFVAYNIYKPFWKFNSMYNSIDWGYERLHRPDVFSGFWMRWFGSVNFKNFWSFGLRARVEPIVNHDYFETRTAGRYYRFPTNYMGGFWVNSDKRKRLRVYSNGSIKTYTERGRKDYYFQLSPAWRISDRVAVRYDFSVFDQPNNVGFVSSDANGIYFGRRDLRTITNLLSGEWLFTPTSGLTARVRHYWSQADYSGYFELTQDGREAITDYSNNHDVNFNAFNIDLVYTWWFAPGSQLSVVWKNSILSSGEPLTANYFTNFQQMVESDQLNSLSVRAVYFLDYENLAVRRR